MYRFIRFPDGKGKAVTFSYDDGVKSDIQLCEILDKYGMKCAFNIPSHWIGLDGHLSAEEIKEIFAKGHEIAVHCENHRAPGQTRAIEGIKEVLRNRSGLETVLGSIVRGMAYPNSGITKMDSGVTYETIRGYLQNLDIAYSRTLGGDNDLFEIPTDWYAWMPTAHHENSHIFEYIEKFVNCKPSEPWYEAARQAKLFYLWGHSYEFNNNNNWDRLEKICSMLGGKDDTWYATNIEIYDYVNAYYSLVFSADEKIVYNPTILDVWFEDENGLHSVKSGETIKL